MDLNFTSNNKIEKIKMAGYNLTLVPYSTLKINLLENRKWKASD
jgi:hypothetical protein